MVIPEDEMERIVAAAIERHVKGDPVRLARAIIEQLWEAGFDLRLRLDAGAIVQNSVSEQHCKG